MSLTLDSTFEYPRALISSNGRLFSGSGNKILFSGIIENIEDAGRCYQINDPTSTEIPDLLPTDGGYVTVEGAVDINRLLPYRNGILVFARNGVWQVRGTNGAFTATGFAVEKITDIGAEFPTAIVPVEDTVYYMTRAAIYRLAANEFNVLVVQDLTSTTIRSKFLEIMDATPEAGKQRSSAVYEKRNSRVWFSVFSEFPLGTVDPRCFVLDLRTQGWYLQNLRIVGITTSTAVTGIENEELNEFVFGDNRTLYKLENRTDFKDYNNIGTVAFLETGPENLGQFSLRKGATSLVLHFKRTEENVTAYDSGTGVYTYDFPSSCNLTSIWDNSTASWKQSTPREMYRLNKHGRFPPTIPSALTEQGDDVVVVKDTLRGSGENVRFKFQPDNDKDMQILGYSVEFSMRSKH